MATQTEVHTDDLTGFEFARKCELDRCDNEAEYMVWSAHSTGMECPATMLRCKPCVEFLIQTWGEILKVTTKCHSCNKRVTGQLSDNLRYIPL